MALYSPEKPASYVYTCPCGATWTGILSCHCTGCHETFTGITAFDRHRTLAGDHGTCRPPAKCGLVQHQRGGDRAPWVGWGAAEAPTEWWAKR